MYNIRYDWDIRTCNVIHSIYVRGLHLKSEFVISVIILHSHAADNWGGVGVDHAGTHLYLRLIDWLVD